NYCSDDPLLDWLEEFGADKGFARDTAVAGYDKRTDFLTFLLAKGRDFEDAVRRHLARECTLVDARAPVGQRLDPQAPERTWDALCAGAEIVTQAAVWNPQNQTYGVADLLVRSDVLARLFPGVLSEEEAAVAAPTLPGARWHYRVLETKFG